MCTRDLSDILPAIIDCEVKDFIVPAVTLLTLVITGVAIGILMSPITIPMAVVPLLFFFAITGIVKSFTLTTLTVSQLTYSRFDSKGTFGALTGVFLTVSAVALGILLAPITLPGAATLLAVILIFGGGIGSVTFGGLTIHRALGF